MRNPFETLGISKRMVRILSDEQLKALAESAFRTLMVHAHPDRGGSTEWAQELNMAHDELADSEKFAKYKEEYTSASMSKREQLDVIKEENARLRDRVEKILNKFFDYVSSSVMEASVKMQTATDGIVSIFNAAGIVLKIFDPNMVPINRYLTYEEKEKILKPFKNIEAEMAQCKNKIRKIVLERRRIQRKIIYLKNSIADIKMKDEKSPNALNRIKELEEKLKKSIDKQRYYEEVQKSKVVALRNYLSLLSKKYREGTAGLLMAARERKKKEIINQSNKTFTIKDGGRLVDTSGADTGERVLGSLSEFTLGYLEKMRERKEIMFLPKRESTFIPRRPINSKVSLSLSVDEFKTLLPKLESILVKDRYLVVAHETEHGMLYSIKGRIMEISRPKLAGLKSQERLKVK
ncbi:MAG: hypothetical protein QW112_02485 [Candidatus Micrarchaeia archaeon]